MSSDIAIRFAGPTDASEIVAMVRELAAFENEPLSSVKLTEADVLRDGFTEPRRFECLVAERQDGQLLGFALFFHNYSTWEGKAGIYLEDLFIRAEGRGTGLGRRMMAHLARVAHDRGCKRLDLWVLHWNPARDFYHRLGLRHMEEWLPYRMTGEAIAQLAQEAN